MPPYSETDRLQYEVEKLIEEIKIFRRPFSQPNSWLAVIGLFISVGLNLSQCASVSRNKELAGIQFERAKLEFEKNMLKNDSLQKVGDSLQAVEKTLAGDYAALQENYNLRKKQVDSIQIRINNALTSLTELSGSTASASAGNAATIIEIKKSLNSISSINKNVVTGNFNKSATRNPLLAKQKEREGFQQLINGNYDGAIAAFTVSENAFNGYHMVYDLAQLIKKNKAALLSDPNKRDEVIKIVLSKKYAYGAPQDLLDQLSAEIK